ncbi:hypothetical protein J1N35_026123, partial [Gossypium stocksii]
MNTLMEEVKHDILEVEDEVQSTIIENNELNIGVQQEFRVRDCDEIVRSENGVFTLIDIRIK